nr:MAG TPA: vitellogenin [Caudoviricetes sp.]
MRQTGHRGVRRRGASGQVAKRRCVRVCPVIGGAGVLGHPVRTDILNVRTDI